MSRRKKQTPSPAAESDGARATPETAAADPAAEAVDLEAGIEAVSEAVTPEPAAQDPGAETGDGPPTESATAAAAALPEELAAVTPDEATQAACTVDPPEHYTVSAPIGRLRVQAAKAAVKHLGQELMAATQAVAKLPDEDVREIVACSLDPDIGAKLRQMFGVSDGSD